MSSAPLYNITLSTVYSSRLREDLETYVIDRQPQGPLAQLTELQDNSRTACDPCGGGLSSGTTKPNRFAIRLPASVKAVYPSARHKTDYVDSYTLPGFLSWLNENGYSTVDMKHVVPVNQSFGFWVEYTDSSTEEFRAAARPRAMPQPTQKSSRHRAAAGIAPAAVPPAASDADGHMTMRR